MGHVATLMDYSRFNYVAQPEDKIPPEDLIPRIGPYDIWATHWGYAPIPGVKTPTMKRPRSINGRANRTPPSGSGSQRIAPMAATPAKIPKPWATPMPSIPPHWHEESESRDG